MAASSTTATLIRASGDLRVSEIALTAWRDAPAVDRAAFFWRLVMAMDDQEWSAARWSRSHAVLCSGYLIRPW